MPSEISSKRRPKVLLIIETCNPNWASVPFVGFKFYDQIRRIADTTLVTHDRNREALQPWVEQGENIVFMEPGAGERRYFNTFIPLCKFRGNMIWPLRHFLMFPIYFFFDRAVAERFGPAVQRKEYDLVHALTPMMPRYPYSIYQYCTETPLVIGPVNGGVPFPPAFKEVGRREFSFLNFLRSWGFHLIPGYKGTYRRASKILSGSSYTKQWLVDAFRFPDEKVELMYENGVDTIHAEPPPTSEPEPLRLLFVGRLVPYKGCDMALEALAAAVAKGQRAHLTVAGDGGERGRLEQLARDLGIWDQVTFTGWLKPEELERQYREAHVFCFPSVREFGGAVVMEAMSFGLPCIVVDNGGIGEYVSQANGFKIAPHGRAHVVAELARIIGELAGDPEIVERKRAAALADAEAFLWSAKGRRIAEIYQECRELEYSSYGGLPAGAGAD